MHGWVSSVLVPLTKCAATHTCFSWCLFTVLLCRLIYADSLRLIVSRLLVPDGSCVQTPADGLWSESVDALQTESHTCCLCTTRGGKNAEKKHFFSLHSDSALWSTLLSLHLSFHLHLKSVSQLLARLCSHQQWGKHSYASRKYVQFQMSSAKPHWLYIKMCHHLRIPSLNPLEFPVHSGTEDYTFECVGGVDAGS